MGAEVKIEEPGRIIGEEATDARLDELRKQGPLPLCYAIAGGVGQDVLASLAARPGQLNEDWEDGELPLSAACGENYRSLDLITILIRAGAQVNARRPSDGSTALHVAVHKDDEHVVRLLLAAGADVNLQDLRGRSAMHVAANAADDFVSWGLLFSGGDVMLQDHAGVRPIDLAVAAQNSDVLQPFSQAVEDWIDARDRKAEPRI